MWSRAYIPDCVCVDLEDMQQPMMKDLQPCMFLCCLVAELYIPDVLIHAVLIGVFCRALFVLK